MHPKCMGAAFTGTLPWRPRGPHAAELGATWSLGTRPGETSSPALVITLHPCFASAPCPGLQSLPTFLQGPPGSFSLPTTLYRWPCLLPKCSYVGPSRPTASCSVFPLPAMPSPPLVTHRLSALGEAIPNPPNDGQCHTFSPQGCLRAGPKPLRGPFSPTNPSTVGSLGANINALFLSESP